MNNINNNKDIVNIPNFENWKKQINDYVYEEIKIKLDDLPDQNYRILYEKNILSPKNLSFIILGNYYNQFIEELEHYLNKSDNNNI